MVRIHLMTKGKEHLYLYICKYADSLFEFRSEDKRKSKPFFSAIWIFIEDIYLTFWYRFIVSS